MVNVGEYTSETIIVHIIQILMENVGYQYSETFTSWIPSEENTSQLKVRVIGFAFFLFNQLLCFYQLLQPTFKNKKIQSFETQKALIKKYCFKLAVDINF